MASMLPSLLDHVVVHGDLEFFPQRTLTLLLGPVLLSASPDFHVSYTCNVCRGQQSQRELFVGATVVDWAWTGELSYPNVCTPASCRTMVSSPLAPGPHILVLNSRDPGILIHIWSLLRRHICREESIFYLADLLIYEFEFETHIIWVLSKPDLNIVLNMRKQTHY